MGFSLRLHCIPYFNMQREVATGKVCSRCPSAILVAHGGDLSHARHLVPASRILDAAAFAVCSQSVIRSFESRLSMSVCHPGRAWRRFEPCPSSRTRFADTRCRGIRRMLPVCHTVIREQALDVRLSSWSRMAHCLRAKRIAGALRTGLFFIGKRKNKNV